MRTRLGRRLGKRTGELTGELTGKLTGKTAPWRKHCRCATDDESSSQTCQRLRSAELWWA